MPLRGPNQPIGQRPPPAAARGREAASDLLNELASKFPMCDTIVGGFTQLTIPTLNVPTGQSAWYSLINFNPQAELGQEVVLFGGYCEQLSTNPTPTTGVTEAAWGDEYGNGAAIVVGEDLPCAEAGNWNFAPCPVAGVDTVLSVSNSRGRVLWSRGFPPGKYTVGWNRRALNMAVVPFVKRIVTGRRLCAALVLNRAQANSGATKALLGLVHVELYYGFTKNTVSLAQ